VSGGRGETHGAVYAQALAEAAGAGEGVARAGEALAAFAATWHREPDVRAFFLSGAISRDAKHAAIDRVFRERAPAPFVDFLHVLLRRQRMWLVPAIAEAFAHLLDVKMNRVPVSLATATPLPPDAIESVRTRLRAALGKEPVLTHVVRPALLGGAVLRVGDVIADGSVRRRLGDLRARLSHVGHSLS
jgi:F-type H+-transporting ATPase subunit delta